ncbi:MAG: hypothetical protein JO320_04070 [Alphaproteobacteria bacterium]|nr:hypothetical protein [Alphaproteobacteria bacterium]
MDFSPDLAAVRVILPCLAKDVAEFDFDDVAFDARFGLRDLHVEGLVLGLGAVPPQFAQRSANAIPGGGFLSIGEIEQNSALVLEKRPLIGSRDPRLRELLQHHEPLRDPGRLWRQRRFRNPRAAPERCEAPECRPLIKDEMVDPGLEIGIGQDRVVILLRRPEAGKFVLNHAARVMAAALFRLLREEGAECLASHLPLQFLCVLARDSLVSVIARLLRRPTSGKSAAFGQR